MSLWRHLTRGLRVLTHRTAADQDAADETQHYFEQTTAALIESGMSPEQARRTARMELGSAREQVREYGWENVIETSWADLRYAARRLRNSPGFSAVCVFTLALGIGASTAIFSAVNPILFEPLPYPHPNRIMMIWDIFQGSRADLTFHTYRELSGRSHSFEAMAVMKAWQPTMTSATQPERFEGQSVSAAYFRALGVRPVLGRGFQDAEDRFKGPHVVILSDVLWRRRFGSDSTIVGRQITLDDNLYTVIGVMPPGFENVLAPSAELWSPLQYDAANPSDLDSREWGHHLHLVARLNPGVAASQAKQELDAIALHPVPQFLRPPGVSLKFGFTVDSLQGDITRGVKPALLAVLGAVLLVLLIACVNVTNLLLARGVQRRGEFAMRAALGAGQRRLVRQLLTESVLLAALGGALGLLIAELGVHVLVGLSPADLPRVSAISVDGTAFAFALAVTTLFGLAVGLFPALQAARGDLITGVQESARRTAGGHQFTRRVLVVTEVALALVLLVSAGLLLRSLQHLFAVAPGFDPSRVLTMQVQITGRRFDEDSARLRFFDQALEAVRRLPGISTAAFTSLLPLSGEQYGVFGARFENGGVYDVYRYVVSPGYLDTMGMALHRGRSLTVHDLEGTMPAALISDSLARARFPGQEPMGRRLHVGPSDGAWYTVVGVVGDVKQASLADGEANAVYLTPRQSWFADSEMSLVVRSRDDVSALAPAIKNAIWSVDKDQPIVRVTTLTSLLAASESQRRFILIVFEAFALVALVLAATGIYGILSGSVTERIREIGVRSALGASRLNILVMVVRQGLTLTGLGIAIGLTGAMAATQAIMTLLFGVSRLDPLTYTGVIALLLAVSVIACWVPAWRAARVDPSITLRAD